MNLDELKEKLEHMPDKELFRFLRKSICESISGLHNPDSDTNAALDVVYSECQRRGKERLYDKIFETISADPNTCQVL